MFHLVRDWLAGKGSISAEQREGGMEGGKDGGTEEQRDRGRDGGTEGRREGWKDGGRDGERERWRGGKREGGKEKAANVRYMGSKMNFILVNCYFCNKLQCMTINNALGKHSVPL